MARPGRHRPARRGRVRTRMALVVLLLASVGVQPGAVAPAKRGSGPVPPGVEAASPGDRRVDRLGHLLPPAPPPPRSFTIAASGDILVHRPVWDRAAGYGAQAGLDFDFRPMFAPVRRVLSSADLAICHLETPLSPTNRDLSSYPVFNVPHQVAEAIAWAGFDRCSTASNHSLDRGVEGVAATLDALDRAGVRHTGTARRTREARRPRLERVNGVRVAHLSYTYGFNGFSLPQGRPWLANPLDPERVLADAAAARRRGAEFVIVSLHWGEEYVVPPTPYQQEVGDRIARSPDVDLILGHHAHVVQPITRVGRTWVVYGMGNFLSNQTGRPGVQDGVIVEVEVRERNERFMVWDIAYTPTWVDAGTTWRTLPVDRTLRRDSVPAATRAALEASARRTTEAITLIGADDLGVLPRS